MNSSLQSISKRGTDVVDQKALHVTQKRKRALHMALNIDLWEVLHGVTYSCHMDYFARKRWIQYYILPLCENFNICQFWLFPSLATLPTHKHIFYLFSNDIGGKVISEK